MKLSEGKNKKAIAVCVSRFSGNESTSFIKNFQKVCLENDFKMFVFSSAIDFLKDINTEVELFIYDLLDPKQFDAVVIVDDTFKNTDMPERIAKKTVKAGVPCIIVQGEYPGCVSVRYNFESSFEKVVRYVIEHHNVKHVNFIAGIPGNPYSDERLDVYIKVMEENGIEVEADRIGYGNFWELPTDEVMDKFLASGKQIDAIICANDFMAIEACRKLREAGIRVPEDVIVSGFDGVELEAYHYPRLATAYYDVAQLCKKVGEVINDIAKEKEVESHYYIGCKFRKGQSCGCVSPYLEGEDIRSFGVKSFEAYRKIRELEASIELLYEEVPLLGNREDFDEVWGTFYYYVNRFFGCDFSLLINSDFLMKDLELWPNLLPAGQGTTKNHYTRNMRVAMDYLDGAFENRHDIKRVDLVPHIDRLFEKDGCVMMIPMHVQDSTIGYAAVHFEPDTFDYFILLTFLKIISQVIEMHKERLDQLNIYSTDQLTHLLNRKGFYSHMASIMASAVKRRIPVAVISIDMNGLKPINDTYGHKEGDYALAKVGEILTEVVGRKGVCTRLGGDEFAIAFSSMDAEKRYSDMMGEIRTKMKEFNEREKKPYELSASMGAACHIPEENDILEHYLMEADKKMYKNKKIIKNMQ